MGLLKFAFENEELSDLTIEILKTYLIF